MVVLPSDRLRFNDYNCIDNDKKKLLYKHFFLEKNNKIYNH